MYFLNLLVSTKLHILPEVKLFSFCKQTNKQRLYICSGIPVEPSDGDTGAEVPGVLSGEVHESQDGARCVEPVRTNPGPVTWWHCQPLKSTW